MIIGTITKDSEADARNVRHRALCQALAILDGANRRSAMVRRAKARIARELAAHPICRENFHDRTAAIWRRLDEVPNRVADFASPSGSQYWFTDEGVVRLADHWKAGIRSCDWFMGDAVQHRTAMDGGAYQLRGYSDDLAVAFCAWDNFRTRPVSMNGARTSIKFEELAA